MKLESENSSFRWEGNQRLGQTTLRLSPTKLSAPVWFLDAVTHITGARLDSSGTLSQFPSADSGSEEYSERSRRRENRCCCCDRRASSCCDWQSDSSQHCCSTNRRAGGDSASPLLQLLAKTRALNIWLRSCQVSPYWRWATQLCRDCSIWAGVRSPVKAATFIFFRRFLA